MPKTSKSKCYQSASDSRRPTCRQPLTALCPSCRRALSRYLRVKAVLLDQRILRRRQAARTKRFQQQELFSDLCADHIALSQEWRDLSQVLADINLANTEISFAICGKNQELSTRRGQVAAALAAQLAQIDLRHLDRLQADVTHLLGGPEGPGQ